MSNLLLDYVFPVSSVTPTPAASTGFLKKLCIVCKPKSGVDPGLLTSCTTQTAIALKTDNLEAQQALDAGMASVYILTSNDLDLSAHLEGHDTDFFTVVVSSDFDTEDVNAYSTGTITISSYANLVVTAGDKIAVAGVEFVAQAGAATLGTATFQAAVSNDATATSLAAQINAHAVVGTKVTASALAAVVTLTADLPGVVGQYALVYTDMGAGNIGASVSGATMTGGTHILNLGTFDGVSGQYAQDADDAADYAAIENRAGFYGNVTNKAKNMIYAFGKLLSNSLNWKNQQYVTMPLDDGIDELGTALALYDDRVSFVISDESYGKRLALFACGGKAIVAPYISRNLQIDLQSKALQWISANQPAYTLANAALLESELEKVVQSYIDRAWITAGTVSITLVEDNFVAAGAINIAEPKALWRVASEMQQTL